MQMRMNAEEEDMETTKRNMRHRMTDVKVRIRQVQIRTQRETKAARHRDTYQLIKR